MCNLMSGDISHLATRQPKTRPKPSLLLVVLSSGTVRQGDRGEGIPVCPGAILGEILELVGRYGCL